MIARHELIQRYGGAREYLDQLIAFAEAARQDLGPDSPLLAQYDYACWMAEIMSYQQFSCQRCGTFVSADPFGPGAYMVEPSTRVCGMCYDELSSTSSTVQRRLARLAVYAHEHPDRCAGLIVDTQRRLHMDDWHLDFYLGLDDLGVTRLALCQRPRPGHEDTDIAMLATIAGCSEAQLRRLFTDEPQLGTDASQASVQCHARSGLTRMTHCRSNVGGWAMRAQPYHWCGAAAYPRPQSAAGEHRPANAASTLCSFSLVVLIV